jgi:hypothetical protein
MAKRVISHQSIVTSEKRRRKRCLTELSENTEKKKLNTKTRNGEEARKRKKHNHES